MQVSSLPHCCCPVCQYNANANILSTVQHLSSTGHVCRPYAKRQQPMPCPSHTSHAKCCHLLFATLTLRAGCSHWAACLSLPTWQLEHIVLSPTTGAAACKQHHMAAAADRTLETVAPLQQSLSSCSKGNKVCHQHRQQKPGLLQTVSE